jgi:hypothetical protein
MTDDQWDKIRPFAEAAAEARMALENAGMRNVQGVTKNRIEQEVNYERLRLESDVASMALSSIRREVLGL